MADVLITPRGVRQSARLRLATVVPLLHLWVRRNLRARYRQSVLRASWSILQPAALLITYGWVFTVVLHVEEEPIPYLSFAWAGLVAFNLVQQSLGAGVASIYEAGGVVTKVYFPREILPLVVTCVAAVDMAVTFGLLVVIAWVQIGPPTIHLLGSLVAMTMLVVWTAAATVLVAVMAVFHRDLAHGMPLVIRVAFIVSPVMYSASLFSDTMQSLMRLNPLAVAIDGIRDGALLHVWPDWGTLLTQFACALICLAVAIMVVGRAERDLADHV